MKKQMMISCVIAAAAASLFALPASAHEGSPCGQKCSACVNSADQNSPDKCQDCGSQNDTRCEKKDKHCGKHKGPGCPEGSDEFGRQGGPRHHGRHMMPPPPSPEMQIQRLTEETQKI